MVTPDNTRYEQDVTPGLVRQLHETLALESVVYRNRTDVDYGELVKVPELIASQCDEGYVLGLPFGRHLRIFYEFDDIEAMRKQFPELLNEIGEIAIKNTGARVMLLEFNDFPRRHHQEHIFVGAQFGDSLEVALMRCRDVREQEIPDPPSGIEVRPAKAADVDLLAGLEERVMEDLALAPPLPANFLKDARWTGIAEIDGQPAGYLRLLDADKRGMLADQFVVDADLDGSAISAALLHAAFLHGRGDNRRALTLPVSQAAVSDPNLAQYGFKHAGDSLRYDRTADPTEVEADRMAKVGTRVKVGKIWGQF